MMCFMVNAVLIRVSNSERALSNPEYPKFRTVYQNQGTQASVF